MVREKDEDEIISEMTRTGMRAFRQWEDGYSHLSDWSPSNGQLKPLVERFITLFMKERRVEVRRRKPLKSLG